MEIEGGAGQRRLRPRHPLSNYRPTTAPHRNDLPGSLTQLFFCSPPYLAPHTSMLASTTTQGRAQQFTMNCKNQKTKKEEGEGEAKAIE